MCGIAGFVDLKDALSLEYRKEVAREMLASLRHRGPDDEGVWIDSDLGVTLGHRRLSILDLSPDGHQPMISATGRYVITFNGEIYNYRELRKELENEGAVSTINGRSDTAVMLDAFEHFGVVRALKRFSGMFAFAVWDTVDRVLFLARDRIGEKPLFYMCDSRLLIFASELKPFLQYKSFKGEIDQNALALFLTHSYVPAPHCIYAGVQKLPPGSMLRVKVDGGRLITNTETYWSLRSAVARSNPGDFEAVEDGAVVDRLHDILSPTVAREMLSDVPLGAFLSGGIDSSLIVALMQAQSSRPVRTFTIGFGESDFNEAIYAKQIAKRLGTDHTELYVTPRDAMEVVPSLPCFYDEPFADSSQIPTYLVSKLARESVTVALTGDGGDEIFGGYIRYQYAKQLWNILHKLPSPVLQSIAFLMDTARLFKPGWKLMSMADHRRGPGMHIAGKMERLSLILKSDGLADMYYRLMSPWPDGAFAGLAKTASISPFPDEWNAINGMTEIERMMFFDTLNYLPDDILVKVDRAAMAVSLESRVPYLDHSVVEFAWQLPVKYRVREKTGKWVLKELLYRFIPREMVDRPKAGFQIPLEHWLRGPLRSWAGELLDERRLVQGGLIDSHIVSRKWKEHLTGEANWVNQLWNVLMFESWRDSQLDSVRV